MSARTPLVLCLGLLAACGPPTDGSAAHSRPGDGDPSFTPSARARDLVRQSRRSFRWKHPRSRVVAGAAEPPLVPLIGEGLVDHFERASTGRVVPRFVHEPGRVAGRARVELPDMASGWIRIDDQASGTTVELALASARDAAAEMVDGLLVYPGALSPHAHVVQRVRAEGTEDFVVFERAPDREELSYSIRIAPTVGLRLAGGGLELLDATGAPRLRVAPPYVMSARPGQACAAVLSVQGCAVDRSPSPPWGRPVTSPCPGATACTCTLRLAWDGRGVVYPALVDPQWTTTADLAEPRHFATAVLRPDGRVLIAGGEGKGGDLASVELFQAGDVTGGTWAFGPSLSVSREQHATTLLADGSVLVTGGRHDQGLALDAERLDVGAGSWTHAGTMLVGRYAHTATLLSNEDGRVLVAGGYAFAGALEGAEIFDPASGAWSPAGELSRRRAWHTASLLPDGRVLVAGGHDNTTVLSSELFHPEDETWTQGPDLLDGRYEHTASPILRDGRLEIMVAGGRSASKGYLASAEAFDPERDDWSPLDTMSVKRTSHAAVSLAGGHVLLLGGVTTVDDGLVDTEIFDPVAGAWSAAEALGRARQDPIAAALSDGSVLVTGGTDGGEILAETELFLPLPTGAACGAANECLSGHCVDGVCCDRACSGECEACAGALTLLGVDGTCGPEKVDPCGAYRCDDTGDCRTSCATTSDCANGHVCTSGTCAPLLVCDGNHTLVAVDGTAQDCGPYRCVGMETCPSTCNSNLDCADHGSCTSDGKCVHRTWPFVEHGAGACRVALEEPAGAPWVLWMTPVIALVRGRRRRRPGAAVGRGQRLARAGAPLPREPVRVGALG